MFNKELYIPRSAVIEKIDDVTSDVKLFNLYFEDENGSNETDFMPGQFIQVSVYGVGEIPISICSSPTQKPLQIAVKKMGEVTQAMHNLKSGDRLGVRGPYGTPFPINKLESRDILFVAGGIGLAPLRSVINYVLDNRDKYGNVTLLHGAQNRPGLIFWDELRHWAKAHNTNVFLTIDKPETGWDNNVGVVTTLFKNINVLDNTYALICGPPIMFKFATRDLLKMGISEERIIVTLERYMKCGVGKCGHCYMKGKYICVDGPVFTYKDLKFLSGNLEPEF
jgi:NAD(P)H-flavin reductase